MYQFKLKKLYAGFTPDSAAIAEIVGVNPADHIKNKKFAAVSVGMFLATILAMSFRQLTGLHLGFIALIGMMLLVLINEIFSKQLEGPSFEDVLGGLGWQALIFYIVLFVLVGAINHVGIIGMVAKALSGYFQQNLILGSTLLYWVTAPIVGIVEYDAYILAFLYLIKDIAVSASISPWPLWWALLWSGTLGSSLTLAGAPTLFVAQSLSEKEDSRKVQLKEFLSYSALFVGVSLVIQYVLLMLFWVIPSM
jgi:Na+/H+ antiporter NhaD/arsenite permease-like protein